MKLYLVQHGAAVPEEEDPDRPLTDEGRQGIQRLASFVARSGTRVARVIHSGKRRALETAVILASVVGPGKIVEEAVSGLGPNDATDQFFTAAATWAEDAKADDIMVVGHQPFMGRMTSRLLVGSENIADVGFQPGTVVCLESAEDGRWVLAWMAGPELLGS
jgi:phosphohistidine phosphatase